MERWSGKVAVVTGASSGIGLATVKALLSNGLIVVGLARRLEKMQNDIAAFPEANGKFHAVKCDVTDDNDVAKAFDWIKNNVGKVQILVNNAGFAHRGKITETSNDILRNVLNVNVLGPVYCTKEALKVIQPENLEAHIININSVLGHSVVLPPGAYVNLYPASKYAITGLTETLLKELKGGTCRVTSVSPGLVRTEMTEGVPANVSCMEAEDIANAIVYILSTPQRVEIKEFTVPAFNSM